MTPILFLKNGLKEPYAHKVTDNIYIYTKNYNDYYLNVKGLLVIFTFFFIEVLSELDLFLSKNR